MGVTSWLRRPAMVWGLRSQARLAIRLLRDPQVPVLAKAIPLLAGLYLVSPIDALPDIVPVLGQLDDISLLVAALALLVRLSPSAAVDHHRAAIAQNRPYSAMRDDVIDAEWHRVDP